ncbi:hypothetical protein BS78_03G133800 [Paspalum vaginatum]|nr:hypothetical protein BS78_03G133800 [Paspalum vaginatum]
MAGSLTGALLPVVLILHLLAAPALARHEPQGSAGSAPDVEVKYNAPTNDGPSPATGHGNQPSPHMVMAQGGAPRGDPSAAATAAASEAHTTFSPNHGHSPATDWRSRGVSQLNTAGVGEAFSGVRP